MKKVFLILLASGLMTSCVIDKRVQIPTAEDQYNHEFVELFGKTDPNHTWSMVESRAVELTVNKPSEVKIYAQYGKDYQLVGKYENVSGTCELTFDAPMGSTNLHVTVDGVPYLRADGRTAIFGDNQNVIATDGFKEHKFSEIKKFMGENAILPERVENTKKVTKDFRVKANGGQYRFYPLFWNAQFFHSFGLYYYDANGEKIEIPFYKNKEGDCLQYKDEAGAWANVEVDFVFDDLFPESKIKNLADDDVVLRSKCYTINNLPKDTEFGFYVTVVKQSDSEELMGTYYSDPALNTPARSFSSFAYLELDGKTYMTIEDHKNDDFDFNDFIFIMEGEQEHIKDETFEYIYATEDLGSTDDFDFNDIVFSVSHVSGQPHADVKLLAAGGTLPAEIWFKNTKCYDKEVHEVFKEESSVMVNTAKGTDYTNLKTVKSYTVEVGKDWSHAKAEYTSGEGNGFKVKVTKNGDEHWAENLGANDGPAPQMLILEPNWLWPVERTSIAEAYPGFGEWGANYNQGKTWVNTVDANKVINWIAK